MHLFRVWAPLPRAVELALGEERFPMRREDTGWWSFPSEKAGPGSEYGFVLDGEGPFPDPRSPWQPHGVHGLSKLVDHSAFAWGDASFHTDPAKLARAVVYELHIGTFTPEGTFTSSISRLDHLVELGVTHVELMPVGQFPGQRGWGYDGVDLYAPHQPYGGPEGLKSLVNACHQRGLATLLDVVYNHLGPSGNYLQKFGPYFTGRCRTPWGPAINFDEAQSHEVRRFFCDNALSWLRDYHFDGLRLDATHAFLDRSARPFLEQLADEVRIFSKESGRPLVLVAESDLNDPRPFLPVNRGGFALDAQWNDDFHHALHVALTGERTGYYEDFGTLADLAKAFRCGYVYDGRFSTHRQKHHGRPAAGLDGVHFLGYAQTHDQIGNRMRGERLSRLVSLGRLKIAAALVLASPFVPMLFQGEEWGASTPFLYFTDHAEPDLAHAVRAGRQQEFAVFGWNPDEVPDPQSADTFEHSRLNWSELRDQPHASLLDWHRRLIQLRRAESALSDGRLKDVIVRFDESARWFVLQRGRISVACNLAAASQCVALQDGNYSFLLSSEGELPLTRCTVELPPDSVAILKA